MADDDVGTREVGSTLNLRGLIGRTIVDVEHETRGGIERVVIVDDHGDRFALSPLVVLTRAGARAADVGPIVSSLELVCSRSRGAQADAG